MEQLRRWSRFGLRIEMLNRLRDWWRRTAREYKPTRQRVKRTRESNRFGDTLLTELYAIGEQRKREQLKRLSTTEAMALVRR